MPLGNAFPVRSTIPDVVVCEGVWTGAGAANMTKATADWSKGIASVNYNAATGKYIITFTDSGQQIVSAYALISKAAGAAPVIGNVIRSTYSVANKNVQVEFWDLATPSLTNALAGEKVYIRIELAKQSPVNG